MKKIILASAVSALFAAPAAALAQAKPPAVPTLDKIFEASGITVSGYIDVAYTRADRNVEAGGFSDRVFDSQNNSFGLHQFGLTVAKQPKEGFGGLVNITVGKDAQVIHSFPENNPVTVDPNTTSMFDITQAYFQYASGPATLIAGKFTTLHGTEVIASTGNTTFSRSILFGAVPFTHTGLRLTWALSDTLSLIAGINNGWDQLTDANKAKTWELGATWSPIKPLNIAISGYSGKEPTAVNGAGVQTAEGTKTSGNLVISYQIIDPLSIGLEYLNVSQDKVPSGAGTIKAKYSGYAGYLTYMLTPKWRGVLRLESFDDHDGFHFPTTGVAGQVKYKEGTLTVSYLPSDSFEARVEGRRDSADQAVFVDSSGSTSKTLTTLALQGLYKF